MKAHLQADDVCVARQDLLHDGLLPVLPVQGPGGTVAVQLPRGVLVTEHVVAHHREQRWRTQEGQHGHKQHGQSSAVGLVIHNQ